MNKKAFKVFDTNLAMLCKRNNVSLRKVFRECEIPRSRYYAWRGDSNGLDKLDVRRIADYFHVTYSFMMSDNSNKPVPPKNSFDIFKEVGRILGADARRLLINYVQLDNANKHAVLQYAILRANAIYGACKDTESETSD